MWSSALAGCPRSASECPEPTIATETPEIPEGASGATIVVEVTELNPDLGLDVVTELSASSGSFEDPFARETTYRCAFDFSGEVEVCVDATYVETQEASSTTEGAVQSSSNYLRSPHVRLSSPLECSETRCTTLICPNEGNTCPSISDFSAQLSQAGSNTARVHVSAADTDDNPETLRTTLSASAGDFDDPSAMETTYTCDPNVGGIIELCALASDGDEACDVIRCTTVLCPGDPPTNTCPVIRELVATPREVPPGQTSAQIDVDVFDPDEFPDSLRVELSATNGVFTDRFATQAVFTCGTSGEAELCVDASDGDPACDKRRCLTVRCPSTIANNVCPQLIVLNAIPSRIPEGETSTEVQSRAQDFPPRMPDGPEPLRLTMRALWGTIENDENQVDGTVTFQDATYICDRPGPTEVCVDATDGNCVKTLCIEITCPNDIPGP